MNKFNKCIAYSVIVIGSFAVLMNLATSVYNIYRLSFLPTSVNENFHRGIIPVPVAVATSTIEPESGIDNFPTEWQPLYDCRKSMGLVLTPVGINKKIKTSKLTEDNPARYKYQLWKHTREGYLINKGYNLFLYLTRTGTFGLADLNELRKTKDVTYAWIFDKNIRSSQEPDGDVSQKLVAVGSGNCINTNNRFLTDGSDVIQYDCRKLH